mgnify:FL=1
MHSSLPKVLHEVGGEPLVVHLLKKIQKALPASSVGVIVGHGKDLVQERIRSCGDLESSKISLIPQAEQRGTGHAVRCAIESEWGQERLKGKGAVLVLPGDAPLVTSELITALSAPLKGASARVLTCTLEDPTGYGRLVRKRKDGPVSRIVEERDANSQEKKIREVAVSMYLFESSFLSLTIKKLKPQNAQGEFYLTDVIAQAVKAKKKVEALGWGQAEDARGVNDPWELLQAREIVQKRILMDWAKKGVLFTESFSTCIDATVLFEGAATVGRGVALKGKTQIAREVVLENDVQLTDVRVGERAHIKKGSVAENSRIGSQAKVGPYAHLRPNSDVGSGSKIGNFVEIKNANIGSDTSIAHLSYVGDAQIGNRVNIGCGFVTCNFDGRLVEGQRKHQTVIEDDVFVGSDCQAVAPVRLGRGCYVASGSTITENVEADSLAIARSRQVNKAGYAKKLRQS